MTLIKNWNEYWDKNRDGRFVKESWSKTRMIHILDRYSKKYLDVLDAGSGSGFFSNYFIKKGCNVYSLDYSVEALEITKKNTHGNSKAYLNIDLLDTKIIKEFSSSFDLIFSDGLFEHFSYEEQKRIHSNFIEIKKEKGIIISFVPNKFSFWTYLRPIFMPNIEETPFTLSKLRGIQMKCGLEILECGGVNTLPFKISPEFMAPKFGMLIYTVSR